jgi:hypothetical protein
MGAGFEGETWPTERMLVGDVKVDGLDRDHWHSWPDKERGWLALCPLPSTDSFQLQAQIGPDEGDQPTLKRFQQIVDERTGGMGIRLYDATWASLYRANIRMVDRYRAGRVFLAGAYNLGWKLAQVLRGGPGWLLDTYEEERLPVAAWMLGITTKLYRQIIPKKGDDVQRGSEFLQLGINYREARLSKDMRNAPDGVRAGDRAPDAPCRCGDGTQVRLFTWLGFGADFQDAQKRIQGALGPAVAAHTIIPAAERFINEEDAGATHDADGHAYRAYGIEKNTQVLVRPDGYIGFMTEDGAADGVLAYLSERT